MIFKNILYLDSFIKIYFEKLERSNFSPNNIQTITISYSIGRIDTPGSRIKESIKINLKECTFINEEIILSFSLEQLHEPHKCEITLHTLTIAFTDGMKF